MLREHNVVALSAMIKNDLRRQKAGQMHIDAQNVSFPDTMQELFSQTTDMVYYKSPRITPWGFMNIRARFEGYIRVGVYTDRFDISGEILLKISKNLYFKQTIEKKLGIQVPS